MGDYDPEFRLDDPPPYASDLALWEPWGRDLYYSRHMNATGDVIPWEDLEERVRSGWRLAAHDYHHPIEPRVTRFHR